MVTLQVASTPVMPVDPDVIRLLAEMLTRATNGEIQGFAIATIESDHGGSVISCGTSYGGEGVLQNVHATIGAIETLKHRFMAERLER